MPQDTRNLVPRQFGPAAQAYVTSSAHAQGESLARLLALVDPQHGWRVLDIATGGGHTALTFAPRVQLVVAGDLTYSMLIAARGHFAEHSSQNIHACLHDAERLPFAARTFDCVTCRLAAHHFPNPSDFVVEAARVLKPGGLLAIVDNVTSGDPKVSRFVNTFEQLRDPSHEWAYSPDDWETFFFLAGLQVSHREMLAKEKDFDEWAARMRVSGVELARLRALLVQAPAYAREWLRPQVVGSRLIFTLHEIIVIGRKQAQPG